MNQIGLFQLGEHVLLRSYQLNNHWIFAPESRKLIAKIVDFNLKQASDKLIYLKQESPVKNPFFFKIKALFLAVTQILKKTDFYLCILKVVCAALVVLQLLVIEIAVYGSIITVLIAAGVYLKLIDIVVIGVFIYVISLFDLLNIGWMALNDFSVSLYLFSKELFKESFKELKEILIRFVVEANCSYSNRSISLKNVSSHGLEKEAILNKKDDSGIYIDPISKKHLKSNVALARNFRLGRFIISLASLTRYLIESSSQEPTTVSYIAHPIFYNRVLSDSEIEILQTDFINFFSCNLDLLQNIFQITLREDEQHLFGKKESINALIYIKATLFYEYIASGHPSFSPEKILKRNIINQMSNPLKKHLFKLLELKKATLF